MRPKPTMEGESFESYNNSGRDGNMTIETRNILYQISNISPSYSSFTD